MQSQDDVRLDAALDELKDDAARAPQGMRAAIMETVRHRQTGVGAAGVSGTDGGVMTKKAMYGLAAAAAVVFAILMVTGFPPDLGGSQGTIGQAKRYSAPQMAAADATIGDPDVQRFLQSDTFAKLIADREAVKVLTNPELRHLLSQQGLAAEFSKARLSESLVAMEANGSLEQLLDNVELMSALQDQQFRRWLADTALLTRLEQAEVRRQLVDNVDLAAALEHAEFAAYLRGRAELRMALADQTMLRALTNVDLTAALRSPDFASALQNPTMLRALRDPGMMQALRSPAMLRALSEPAFASAVNSAAFAQAIAAADLTSRR